MKTQVSYKFSEKFWKKVVETFNINNLLEVAPKKAEKLYELDPDDMNVNLKEAQLWLKKKHHIKNPTNNFNLKEQR